jgi:hypothetical protein
MAAKTAIQHINGIVKIAKKVRFATSMEVDVTENIAKTSGKTKNDTLRMADVHKQAKIMPVLY